jgi:ABC-type transport system substrate-binding protein
MRRRTWLGAAAGWAAAAPMAGASRPAGPKTFRVAFNFAETGFDPPQVSDQASVTVNAHIFESPLTYDPLARPVVLRPLTAASLPEVSDDHRRFVFTIRPGIHFSDDPVFGGRPRELVAADYVYSIKRYYDPAIRTEHLYRFENAGILGLSELRRRVLAAKTPFPYDEPVAGLRVLDRYRFEVRLAEPEPRFVHTFASPGFTGAVAREVVEAYATDLMAHPVGTGPFRLASWRRASRIVLERNPAFREQHFDSVPPADAPPALKAMAASLAGQRLPRLDRVEVSIISESQPRWLAFVGGELDWLELPGEFAPLALSGEAVAPHLARRGVTAWRRIAAEVTHTFFNGDDPVVGGLEPHRVALRRAVGLAWDSAAEIRLVRRGQAIPAQSMLPPHTYGYDPALKSEASQASLARAQALLDVAGYVDRDGDGFREQPDGTPLVLRLASTEDQTARALNDLWRRRMTAAGLRMVFEPATFGELIKRALAGELMMWGFTWSAGDPDADFFLGLAYGPNADQSNDARFRLAAFDRLYERQRRLPDGPERLGLIREAQRLMLAYLPYLPHVHRLHTELMHAHVRALPRHEFRRDHWLTVDLA